MASTDDFNKACVGAVAMEGCGTCGQSTGAILLKKRGKRDAPEYRGAQVLVNPGARCEFCHFLGMWAAQEGKDLAKDPGGAAKIVREDAEGVRHLVAFVPFTKSELLENPEVQVGGERYPWGHGMVILAEPEGDQLKLTKVLEKGLTS